MTYPTIDGVVDTLQWEGFSEGTWDMRYLSLLKKLDPSNPFFDRIQREEYVVDLDSVRDECARLILKEMGK